MSVVKRTSMWRRWGRRLAWGVATAGTTVVGINYLTDRSLTRSLRTIGTFAYVAYLYKTNSPSTVEEYSALHRRAAERILHVCLQNEGLYIKLGQGLNAMSHVLPREYTDMLSVLLDQAPPVSLPDIRRVVREDTGQELEQIFDTFDPTPVASASIAQVHRAHLRGHPPHLDVAVKVQKPYIATQAKWDIYTYRLISYLVECLFGLSTRWSRKTIIDGLQREMNFEIEAANATRARHLLAHHPHVYVPEVMSAYTTRRLLVMEWIEATKLRDVAAIKENFRVDKVLRTLFNAFGDMVFHYGFVHCDPHPANILVRRLPTSSTRSPDVAPRRGWLGWRRRWQRAWDYQVVFIDFGLCVPLTERFRVQYALLFKSLVMHDMDTLQRVIHSWGIVDVDTFASMQMQKPMRAIQAGEYGEVTKEEVRAMQRRAHDRADLFLRDAARIPRELPLVARGVFILHGVNRLYDSPVNRVNMFVNSAVNSLGPLRDFDGVERYLQLVRDRVADNARRGGRASGSGGDKEAESVKNEGAAAQLPESFESVYDVDADALRDAQAAAMCELAQERHDSLVHFTGDLAASVYNRMRFQATLIFIALVHSSVQWYNALLRHVMPSTTLANRLRARTLEERIDVMADSMQSTQPPQPLAYV